jgi:hypothetical protein
MVSSNRIWVQRSINSHFPSLGHGHEETIESSSNDDSNITNNAINEYGEEDGVEHKENANNSSGDEASSANCHTGDYKWSKLMLEVEFRVSSIVGMLTLPLIVG